MNSPYPELTMTASGGIGALTWSATGLPAGVSIDATSGLVSGTPTVTGPFTPTITVTRLGRLDGQPGYSITINARRSIATASLPDGAQSVAYSSLLAGTNGTPATPGRRRGSPPD